MATEHEQLEDFLGELPTLADLQDEIGCAECSENITDLLANVEAAKTAAETLARELGELAAQIRKVK